MKDLSVTAKYTAHCWKFGKFECAELLDTDEAKFLFDVTNAILDLTSGKAAPSLPHSLVQRHTIIDRLLSDWLLQEGGGGQVLELAAGLSARGVRFTSNPDVSYTEVDNLRFVSGDLTRLDLESLVDPARPVFLIAEGLFMYLQADAQRVLWRRLASLCAQPGSAHVFDLVPSCEEAQANRAGRVLDLGLRLVTGGRTFAKDERTRGDLSSDLVDAGFDSVTTHDPSGDLDRWNLPHTRVPTKQLVFHASGGGAGAPTS